MRVRRTVGRGWVHGSLSAGSIVVSGSYRVVLASAAVLLVLVGLVGIRASSASAAPHALWNVPPGSGAGQVNTPRGSATAPLSAPNAGHVFVAAQANRRIDEFTAWGEFVKAWGWNVVESGPGNDMIPPEDEFEICVPADGDICQGGTSGTSGVGQFNLGVAVAVDSAGAVYAYDTSAAERLQKFDADGNFEWMVGGGVNQGGGTPANPGNLCTAEHIENGDTCGAGSAGPGDGQFGNFAALSTNLAITADDKVYVGDIERIQRFNTDGEHQENIGLPGETVNHLAVDAAGNIYVAYRSSSNNSKPDVVKLDSSGVLQPVDFEVSHPRGLAVAPDGDVYAFEASAISTENGGSAQARIRHFDPSGEQVETIPPEGEPTDLSSASSGLSVQNCGTAENSVYHSNNSPSFVRAYSEAPDEDDCGPPPVVEPLISETHATAVDTAGATVRALINPLFWDDTTYFVQYATPACLEGPEGWEEACVQTAPEAPVAHETGVVDADLPTKGVALGGLSTDTTYSFRFVAQSSGGGPAFGEERTLRTYPAPTAPGTDCPNQVFRVGPSAGLPDCRAYEMVSPLDKNGGDVNRALNNLLIEPTLFSKSAADGEGITYSAGRAFADPAGAPFTSQYLSRRSPGSGWSTESISPPMGPSLAVNDLVMFENQYRAFSEDLCNGWLIYEATPPLTEAALDGYPNVYRRQSCESAGPAYEAMIDDGVVPPVVEPERFALDVMGASDDGRHAIFRLKERLVAGTFVDTYQVYERYPGGLRPVCVLPDETLTTQPCSAGTANLSEGGSNLTDWSKGYGRKQMVGGAMSEDGSRIVWSGGAGLFVRIDGSETVEISNSSSARFQAAADDGSAVIFSVGAQLKSFDVDGETTTDIAGGLVETILGASEDATRVYFVSTQALPSEANSEGDEATGGQNNLYYTEVGSGEFQFLGTLAAADIVTGSRRWSPVQDFPAYHSAQVSADGSAVAFQAHAALTGADNVDRDTGNALTEVFAYDAEARELACASCLRGGARPVGRQIGIFGEGELWASARLPSPQNQTYTRRPLSEDGSRLFFESFNRLVLGDTNGAQDVYEFRWADGGCEADGTLPLQSSESEPWGCLALISSGKSPTDSEFLDADRSGDNVFIATESSLLPQDSGLRDAYVARVDGGLSPPTGPAECEGEACQGAASAPSFQRPASSAFSGPSDPVQGVDCGARGRRAKRFANGARRGRRALRRSNLAPAKARRVRQGVRRNARRARALSKSAKRCRRANRAANTSGRAGR